MGESPKDLFRIFEKMHFFFEKPELAKNIKLLRVQNIEQRLNLLVYDMAVLLECDVSSSRFASAFQRYCRNYQGLSNGQLWDYIRYLHTAFRTEKIDVSEGVVVKTQRPYEQSRMLNDILEPIPF